MKKMDVVTNNIANADTRGFKRDRIVTQAFSEEMFKKLDDKKYEMLDHSQTIGEASLGVFVESVHTDFSNGAFEKTEAPLDVAINGEGFFCITTDGDDEKYTRDGSFTLDPQGYLRTTEGNFVKGEDGLINVTSGYNEGNITIDNIGNVYSGTEIIGKLKMINFSNPDSLRKAGDNLYDRIEESEESPFNGVIAQGYIEMSNANSVQEMVEMINSARVYEANSKAIKVHDTILQRVVNDVGRKS